MAYPSVSILLPVLDEAGFIDACLDSLSRQDYRGPLEIVIADGGSRDGTIDKLADWSGRTPSLVLIDNPRRLQSHGLNLAAQRAAGEILVRADAHTVYAPDYIRRSVEVLEATGASAVGGPMRPEGTTPFGRAVARAMISRYGVGPGAFHDETASGDVDTVYLGAFRQRDLAAIGGFRTLPHGAAEDADLYARWRRAGGRILLDPGIRSRYRPRQTAPGLWKQFWRYGAAKADLVLADGRWPSIRSAVPPLFVLTLAGSLVIGVLWTWWPAVGLVVAWTVVLGLAAREADGPGDRVRTMAAAAIMHLSYGLGLTLNLFRRPTTVRARTDPGLA